MARKNEALEVIVLAAICAISVTTSFYLAMRVDSPYTKRDNDRYQTTAEACQKLVRPYGIYIGAKEDQKYPRQVKRDRYYEICQQIRSASAAEYAADIAASQYNVGILGFGFVVAATIFAGLAMHHTRRQADVAEFTNSNIARPFVFCERFITIPHARAADPNTITAWEVLIEWKNFGQTPAKHMLSTTNVRWFDAATDPVRENFPDGNGTWNHAQTLGPGQIYYSRNFIGVDDVQRAWRGDGRIVYWSWVEYDGLVSGKRHRTEVCALLLAGGDPSNNATQFSNRWITAFNAADADCVHKPKTSGRYVE